MTMLIKLNENEFHNSNIEDETKDFHENHHFSPIFFFLYLLISFFIYLEKFLTFSPDEDCSCRHDFHIRNVVVIDYIVN